ncbi:DUF1045 domain-containing protein [Mesorhizobium tianshanense]|uniref:DUF1045 domain-containing protein n=1 Tax=Mesorhizobium tianshanense TaxID=39844 RepID=UPI0023E7E97D|nr:DUF1045 domain-containing protein [Mesorhizobium tianshanense]
MSSQSSGRRYALHYAPAPTHPLSRTAALWLGRDPFDPDRPARTERPRADVQLTAEPRRYGFHATLKAPFRLAPGTNRQELEAAIQQFIQRRPPCPIAPLRVTTLGKFSPSHLSTPRRICAALPLGWCGVRSLPCAIDRRGSAAAAQVEPR